MTTAADISPEAVEAFLNAYMYGDDLPPNVGVIDMLRALRSALTSAQQDLVDARAGSSLAQKYAERDAETIAGLRTSLTASEKRVQQLEALVLGVHKQIIEGWQKP